MQLTESSVSETQATQRIAIQHFIGQPTQNKPPLTPENAPPPWGVPPSVRAIRTRSQGLVFYVFFVFTHAVGWVGPAVEGFGLMDRARVEACLLPFQEGATLRNENSVSIMRVTGINRYVLQNVYSSFPLPTHYVLVGRLKRPPKNDTAVPRPLAPVSLQQSTNQIRLYAADKLE